MFDTLFVRGVNDAYLENIEPPSPIMNPHSLEFLQWLYEQSEGRSQNCHISVVVQMVQGESFIMISIPTYATTMQSLYDYAISCIVYYLDSIRIKNTRGKSLLDFVSPHILFIGFAIQTANSSNTPFEKCFLCKNVLSHQFEMPQPSIAADAIAETPQPSIATDAIAENNVDENIVNTITNIDENNTEFPKDTTDDTGVPTTSEDDKTALVNSSDSSSKMEKIELESSLLITELQQITGDHVNIASLDLKTEVKPVLIPGPTEDAMTVGDWRKEAAANPMLFYRECNNENDKFDILNKKLDLLLQGNSLMKMDNSEIKKENTEIKKENIEINSQLAKMNIKYNGIQKENNEIKTESSAMKKNNVEINRLVAKMNMKYNSIQKEHTEIKKSITALTNQNMHFKTELARITRENSAITTQLTSTNVALQMILKIAENGQ